MTDRERFVATMHYRPRDRAPICDFGFWDETIVLWHDQGLPRDVGGGHDTRQTNEFFGMDVFSGGPGPNISLCPAFEHKVLEERPGGYLLVQQSDGVVVLTQKFMGSIPQHHSHLLTDRQSWRELFKPKLDPSNPHRFPQDWSEWTRFWNDPHREIPATANCGSLYGWIRNMMGVENVSMVVYDDPAWFEEMVTTLADLTIACLTKAFEHGARFDSGAFWEDMCYSGGPLLGPAHFRQFLVPQYRRITDLLRKHGTDVVWVDCDGKIDDLIPLWLDGGVNCMFPIEVGTWGADAVRYRREYGKQLLLMGGVDKHILAGSKGDIAKEVRRLAPLVEEGGYIGFADHRVPPDVPLENYMFYLRTVRDVWGHGINLKPMGRLEESRVLAGAAGE